jgi:histidinol-phosphate phosphatase family protein
MPTLFLDRDGVINRRTPGEYVKSPEEFVPLHGLGEALQLLSIIFDPILVVTNQQGLGKGLMGTMQLADIHQKMMRIANDAGGRIDRIYYCPHTRENGCPCRKPATGMAWQALEDFPEIDFENAWMVGDSMSDIEFADRLGLHTVLIRGKIEELDLLSTVKVDFAFDSLLEFAKFMSLGQNHRSVTDC